ncbi:hypothetical protein GUJ93_ZPchr0010g10980 [Zizania palustris]|uniref:Uncharacterized protein n=1 Tax=Zizania palustris TaxID=103762 RepID=A0A8J5W8N8_ZIZPA|nr:hypothetical protein GUJ93_ZPchr0010g10980 [Zizania palustris]
MLGYMAAKGRTAIGGREDGDEHNTIVWVSDVMRNQLRMGMSSGLGLGDLDLLGGELADEILMSSTVRAPRIGRSSRLIGE